MKTLSLVVASICMIPAIGCERSADTVKQHSTGDQTDKPPVGNPSMDLYLRHMTALNALQVGQNKVGREIHRLHAQLKSWSDQGLGLPPSYLDVCTFLRKNLSVYRDATATIDYTNVSKELAQSHKALIDAIITTEDARIKLFEARSAFNLILLNRRPLPEWVDTAKLLGTEAGLRETMDEALTKAMTASNNLDKAVKDRQSVGGSFVDKFARATANVPTKNSVKEWFETPDGKNFKVKNDEINRQVGYDQTMKEALKIDEEERDMFPTSEP